MLVSSDAVYALKGKFAGRFKSDTWATSGTKTVPQGKAWFITCIWHTSTNATANQIYTADAAGTLNGYLMSHAATANLVTCNHVMVWLEQGEKIGTHDADAGSTSGCYYVEYDL